MLLSAVLTAFATPLLILIIRFEKDKQNRTLINQLVTCLMYLVILPNSFLEIIFTYRYSFGYMSEALCYLDLLVRPSTVMMNILILDAICVIRYVFIFHMKNPTAAQDDFWKSFLFILLAAFSFLSHAVFIILPGNNPNYFYLCMGEVPKNHKNNTTKVNFTLSVVLIFTILAHCFVGVKYLIYSKQGKKKINDSTLATQISRINIDKHNLANFASNSLWLIYLLAISFVPLKINTTKLEKFNSYPEYLWMYVFHLYLPPINQIFVATLLIIKNSQLRSYVKREIHAYFRRFICQKNHIVVKY